MTSAAVCEILWRSRTISSLTVLWPKVPVRYMPLIVYLDSQDYITLFNEQPSGPSHAILRHLIECRDRREIVIGFSFATIAEFITEPTAEHREERVRRGQLIKTICGPNAFPLPSDFPKGAKFPNDGMWMWPAGKKVLSAEEMRLRILRSLGKRINDIPGANRKRRRSLGRKPAMLDLLRQIPPGWKLTRDLIGDLPVSDEVLESGVFTKLIRGVCDDDEFERVVNRWASDPAEFSRIYYEHGGKPDVRQHLLNRPLREFAQLTGKLEMLTSRMAALETARNALKASLIEGGVRRSDAIRITRPYIALDPDFSPVMNSLAGIIGHDRVGHFDVYLKALLRKEYKMRSSDGLDLMQFCYAYDCDLFRCDKAMASVFRDYEPFASRLVGRFAELPEKIEAAIKSRADSPEPHPSHSQAS